MATFTRVHEVEHEIGERGRLALRVTSADVEFRAVDGPKIRVRGTYDLRAASDEEADRLLQEVRLRETRDAGSLELDEPKNLRAGPGAVARLIGIDAAAPDYRVDVELPRFAEVQLSGVSGDVRGHGLQGTQEYHTVSGDLYVSDLGGVVSARTVSGDVTLRAVQPTDVHAASVSGDVSVTAPRIGELRVNTVSGDVEVEGELDAGPAHRVETVSGDLSIGMGGGMTLEVRGLSSDVRIAIPHRSEGSRDRRRYVVGDGAASVTFRSMSGDARVAAPRRGPVPVPPSPPAPPAAPPPPPSPGTQPDLEILRALERGEIGVDEAARRLAEGAPDA
jgi:hypothetical protein